MVGLQGKVALITGAGSGIGQATAELLADEGVRIGALELDAAEARRVAGHIGAHGGEAVALIADISQARQVEACVRELHGRYGRLDIVFANAGVNGVWAPLEQLGPEDFDRTLRINLHGTFHTIKYSVPYLKQGGGGSVIITSSVNGTRIFSNSGATAYSCSKAAQVTLAKMLALELAPDKIRVNVICPGAVRTNIKQSTEARDLEEARIPVEYPAGKLPLTGGEPGEPEQVAKLVRFLASEESSLVTGTEIWIDAAESLLVG
ncbi:MAG: SDR family oxidoreductase [Armatimonadetes bacterium]|nr:SDR family oxidoreductase [Armatimonadota bacterium]